MDNLKYFPLYFNRFMDGVRGYNESFIGIYIMLLCRQAEIIRIPDDLEKLSRWMGGTKISAIKKVLDEKFQLDEQGYFNVVMQDVLNEIHEKSEKARKSINSRWNKVRNEYERNTNVSETNQKSDTNCILIKESKVKENKIKENKINESKEKKADEPLDFWNKSFNDFSIFRKQMGKKMAEVSRQAWIDKLKKLSSENEIKAKEIINQSIENGWQGIFEIKQSINNQNYTENADGKRPSTPEQLAKRLADFVEFNNQRKSEL